MKIQVVHNRGGWGISSEEHDSFEYFKNGLIDLIKNNNENGFTPQIGSCLCALGDDKDTDDIGVYWIKTIWHYENRVVFILDENQAEKTH